MLTLALKRMFISICTNAIFATLCLTVNAEKSSIDRQIRYKNT